MNKKQTVKLDFNMLFNSLVPLIIFLIGIFISKGNIISMYEYLDKADFSLPFWMISVILMILLIFIGYFMYVYNNKKEVDPLKKQDIMIFIYTLILNVSCYPILFFKFQIFDLAYYSLILSIFLCIIILYKIRKEKIKISYIFLVFIAYISYLSYLNYYIFKNN